MVNNTERNNFSLFVRSKLTPKLIMLNDGRFMFLGEKNKAGF